MRKIISFLALAAIMALASCTEAPRYVVLSGYAQGGTYSVKFNTKGMTVSPQTAAHAIDSILTCIDTTLSGYNPGSMLSRYNKGEKVYPSPMFTDIYQRAKDLFTQTDSTVDVTAAPLFDLWSFGFTGEDRPLPSDDTLKQVLSCCGMANFSGNLSQASPGQELNYNAIAQGYSCDVVAAYLYSVGVKNMLVDIGEIYCDGIGPMGSGWNIAVDTPADGNNTPGADIQGVWHSGGQACGVVTSGNYRKFFVRDGKKYSHTIDPRTGRPVEHNLLSATIIAPDACTADAMATACMVMGLDAAKNFLSRCGYPALLIYDQDGQLCTLSLNGFKLK